MLFDTYVAPSKIEGLGLLANVDIPADTRIWRLDPGFDLTLTDEKLETLPEWHKQYFLRYCYKHRGLYFFCIDNARFMNHSETPNTKEKRDGTYSINAILKGEEIVCNYANMGEFVEDLNHNMHI